MLSTRARAAVLLHKDDTTPRLQAPPRARPAMGPPHAAPTGTWPTGPATLVQNVPGKGRGVFAARPIAKGEVFDRAPVIVIPKGQLEHIAHTVLDDYCYAWGEERELLAVALGNGSLYNHAFTPNAMYKKRIGDGVLEYTALRDVDAGEELLINYNGEPTDQTPLWFDAL